MAFSRPRTQTKLPKIKRMNIHQLSVRHDQSQDRLLVNVNTTADEELKFWLTRRLMTRLWPALNQLVMDHFSIPPDAQTDGAVDLDALDEHSKQVLLEAQQQSALQGADFDTPYKGDKLSQPLGDLPLLVTKIDLSISAGRHLKLRLCEELGKPEAKREFQMELSSELTFGLVTLLKQALAHADWRLDALDAAAMQTKDEAVALDLADRPQYLN
jgi:hypothetical protein